MDKYKLLHTFLMFLFVFTREIQILDELRSSGASISVWTSTAAKACFSFDVSHHKLQMFLKNILVCFEQQEGGSWGSDVLLERD